MQNIYARFYNNINNKKRRIKRFSKLLNRIILFFYELKEKALIMKRGLTDDNPVYEVRSFYVQLIEWEKDLIDLADKLHEKWCNVIYHTFDIFVFYSLRFSLSLTFRYSFGDIPMYL